jgi:hypothetical protein
MDDRHFIRSVMRKESTRVQWNAMGMGTVPEGIENYCANAIYFIVNTVPVIGSSDCRLEKIKRNETTEKYSADCCLHPSKG